MFNYNYSLKTTAMFHHVKDLQFNARVSKPDYAFAALLLEQFGGENGELKAAMQYFTQAFAARMPYPDKYDMLMDIATEEFSHLEIVGATIQMLLKGINGELKDAANEAEIMKLMEGNATKENYIHNAFLNPQNFIISAGGPRVTNSMGIPWQGSYVNAEGDLTVDLRSDIAAESRAKIVYERLMQFTDDAYVKETLSFLMTREIAHFEMFQAALSTISPNYPPGVLQRDPRYSNKYFNMSNGNTVRGPWNEGNMPETGEPWVYIDNPVEHVHETEGLQNKEKGMEKKVDEAEKMNEQMSKTKSDEIKKAEPKGVAQWSAYDGK